MEIKEQKRYYNRLWKNKKYANLFGLQRAIAILNCFNEIGLVEPRILDMGAGTGWLTSILSEFGPTTGIELSNKAVEIAQKNYPTARFVNGNIFDLEIEQNSFDVVVSQEVIEHVENQARYLQIAAQYLKPNGFLILTTPNGWVFSHLTQEKREMWEDQPIENRPTPWGLRKLLQKQFRIVSIRTIILNFGDIGIFRIVNSAKLQKLIKVCKMKKKYDSIRCRYFFGLHIVALCQLKSTPKRRGTL